MLFADSEDYQRHLARRDGQGGLVDFSLWDRPCAPYEAFGKLRWGGQHLFASRSQAAVLSQARAFAAAGFELEVGPSSYRPPSRRRWGWGWAKWLRRPMYYFVARKVLLVPPGESSDRFTYHVHLIKRPKDRDYIVCKEVPSVDSLVRRLAERHADVPAETLERRARKFTEKIFPTFLTREAGILRLLQRDLPPEYRHRVPRVLGVEDDGRGFVRRLYLNWLRNGGEPLTQLAFAEQSADLLGAIHDNANVMHLDLRLDNMVITPGGVGFVDFGSAVREGEKLADNPLLSTLFDELMRTSQIQVMLEKMLLTGHVTSDTLRSAHRKVEKAVDVFYLAVQFTSPHSNPDLADLIRFDPVSEEARQLAALTARVLRPLEPANPPYKSARDLLAGVRQIVAKSPEQQSAARDER